MTEIEQLRREVNELRERVAVLESKQAPPPAKFFGALGVGGPLGEAARRGEEARRQQEEQRRRNLQASAGAAGTGLQNMGGQIGVSTDWHLGLVGTVLNKQLGNLYGSQVQASNPCACSFPFIPPEGDTQV